MWRANGYWRTKNETHFNDHRIAIFNQLNESVWGILRHFLVFRMTCFNLREHWRNMPLVTKVPVCRGVWELTREGGLHPILSPTKMKVWQNSFDCLSFCSSSCLSASLSACLPVFLPFYLPYSLSCFAIFFLFPFFPSFFVEIYSPTPFTVRPPFPGRPWLSYWPVATNRCTDLYKERFIEWLIRDGKCTLNFKSKSLHRIVKELKTVNCSFLFVDQASLLTSSLFLSLC